MFTDRQNRLLLAEDWTKIYLNAESQSYDFDSRRARDYISQGIIIRRF